MGIDMRDALREKGYAAKYYAESRKLDYDVFRQVLIGALVGARRGKAMECARALYKDGVLPENHPSYKRIEKEVGAADG